MSGDVRLSAKWTTANIEPKSPNNRILTPTQTSGAAAATALFAPRRKRGISGTMELQSQCLSRRLRAARNRLDKSRNRRVDQKRHAGNRRQQFMQQLQPLRRHLMFKLVTPVTLPPGRLRLATSPNSTESAPPSNTIGIVVVAALAASAAGMLVAAITAT